MLISIKAIIEPEESTVSQSYPLDSVSTGRIDDLIIGFMNSGVQALRIVILLLGITLPNISVALLSKVWISVGLDNLKRGLIRFLVTHHRINSFQRTLG